MPHASLASPDTAPPAHASPLALPPVNGSNQLPIECRGEKLSDVFHLVVECPDGVERHVILDERVSVNKIPQILEKVCRQLGIDDAMEAVVSENPIESSDLIEQEDSPDDTASLLKGDSKFSEDLNDKSKSARDNSELGPLYLQGKKILCHHCGYLSRDLTKCQRCKAKFNSTLKFFNDAIKKGDHHEERKKGQKKKKVVETECVTILSSDEEEKRGEDQSVGGTAGSTVCADLEALYRSIAEKEPVITDSTPATDTSAMSGGGVDLSELMDSPSTESCVFDCRTVRIGSYKVVPSDKVLLTTYGLKIRVPSLKGDSTTVMILRNEIVKVLVYFGNDLPVMFYYITAPAGHKIRAALHMSGKEGQVYFDPTSSEEIHKRITLLPDSIPEESRLFIRSIYEHNGLLGELGSNEANEILLRAASKKDVNSQGKKVVNSSTSSTPCQEIQQIMIYPPPPVKGGISINTEDYACLGEDQFLNDVIIDFYLKYVVQNMLSEEDRKRTHVFSSFFYKRLTSNKSFQDSTGNLSPAEKRHSRVKGWTKGVNLFAKDFIIIPINESSHWFLAIICFPGLHSVVRMSDNQPIDDSGRRQSARSRNAQGGSVPNTIGETTITVVSQQGAQGQQPNATISLDPEGEERDEADGNDEDLEPNSSDDEGKENGDGGGSGGELLDEAFPRVAPPRSSQPQAQPRPTYPPQEPIKQPCILIFDSLMGASRSRVIATLREYLHVEYRVKHKGAPRDFSKNCVKGTVPKVPQQNNFTDCGLYVLQYVEEFFKNPLTDYRMPLRLQEWFQSEIVARKRYEIQQLLHKLMDDQGVDRGRVCLPRLDLRPDGRRCSEGDEEPRDDTGGAPSPLPDDDDDDDPEEEEEELMGEEEEEDERMEEEVLPPQQVSPRPPSRHQVYSMGSQVSVTPQPRVPMMLVGRTPPPPARVAGPAGVRGGARPAGPAPPSPGPRPLQPSSPVRPVVPSSGKRRDVLPPTPELTIRKKPTIAGPPPPAQAPPPPAGSQPPRRLASVSQASLQRISSSVEITKRKV